MLKNSLEYSEKKTSSNTAERCKRWYSKEPLIKLFYIFVEYAFLIRT